MAMASTGLRQAMDIRNRASYTLRSPCGSQRPRPGTLPAALLLNLAAGDNFDSTLSFLGASTAAITGAAATDVSSKRETPIPYRTPERMTLSACVKKIAEPERYQHDEVNPSAHNHNHEQEQKQLRARTHRRESIGCDASSKQSQSPPINTQEDDALLTVGTRPNQYQDTPRYGRDDDLGGALAPGDHDCNDGANSMPGKPASEPLKSSAEDWYYPPGNEDLPTAPSDFGLPGKLMELMDDRDRAVQLCLQVGGGGGEES